MPEKQWPGSTRCVTEVPASSDIGSWIGTFEGVLGQAPRGFRISVSRVAFALLASVTSAAAQPPDETDVALSLQGGVSWRPVDYAYVGNPYLDEGLGGLGPGFTLGADVRSRRLVFAFEYGYSRIDVVQTGRLVPGTAEGQLREHLYSFLAGASVWSSSGALLAVLGGFTVSPSEPRQDGTPIDASMDPSEEEKGWAGLTVGANYASRLKGRLDFVASGRYSFLPRSRRAEELGVSHHGLRFAVGVRIRLTG
jgi:hypothetical protein